MYNKIVIGLDQSYTRTGVSIAVDGKLVKVSSTKFKGCKNKSEKRKHIRQLLTTILEKNQNKAKEMVIHCERVRTFSHSSKRSGGKGGGSSQEDMGSGQEMFISTNYIKATGALIATIVDTAYDFGLEVYSVDTRSWKAQVVGSSKSKGKDKKALTLEFVKHLGFDMGNDDDAADSACIALYGFIPVSKQSLKKEE